MREPEPILISPSIHGVDRYLKVSLSYHHDVVLRTWDGQPDVRNPWSGEHYAFPHGSQMTLFAAIAGFLTRAGLPETDIYNTLRQALDEECEEPEPQDQYGLDAFQVDYIAHGKPFPGFDIDNLECLVVPLPPEPGTTEMYGGTGLYTRRGNDGTQLVIRSSDTEKPEAAFTVADMPILGRSLSAVAFGEYKTDMINVIGRRFPQN